MKKSVVAAALAGLALSVAFALPARAADVVGLITKTDTNPFFVKMKEGAQAKAKELGLNLQTFAGKYDGDNDSQVAAIESLISAGAKGFAIVPSDSKAIVPAIKKARDAGLLVIDLDTPTDLCRWVSPRSSRVSSTLNIGVIPTPPASRTSPPAS